MTLDLLAPLLDYGLSPIQEGDWLHRGRAGAFHPIGVVAHHTALGQRGGPEGSLQTVINGRPDLAGPLCNGYVCRLGHCHLISGGRANHGGSGYSGTLTAARSGVPVTYHQAPKPDDGVDGNAWYLGIEVENDGVGEQYPDIVVKTFVTMIAAWTDAFGWKDSGAVHHRQHTLRKVDMSLDIDLPRWTGTTIFAHHQHIPPGPEPLPTQPQPWRYSNVDVVQIPVHVSIDNNGNGYNDAACSISKVIGAPRMNGTLTVYDVSPTLRFETYGIDGKTRIEVQGAKPNTAVDFVVSAVA